MISLAYPASAKIAVRAVCALVALATVACNDASAPVLAGPAIEIVPVVDSVFQGDTVHLAARVFDQAGAADTAAAVTWTVSDTTLARVVRDSILALLQPGVVRITARSGPVATHYDLEIGRLVVQRVELTPGTISMGRTDRLVVAARVLGQGDRTITGRTVTFASDDTLVATILGLASSESEATALLTAVGPGSATIRASVDGLTATTQVGVVVVDTGFTLTQYDGSLLPVLLLADTVVTNGQREFNELYADSGTLVLSGLLQQRYELEVLYSVYHATQRGSRVEREFRFRLRGEHDRGLVTVGTNGNLSLLSELIGPHLEHTATVQPDGYLVNYRIAGTDSTLDLGYRRVTPTVGEGVVVRSAFHAR